MKKIMVLLAMLMVMGIFAPVFAATSPISVDLGGTTMILPFQKVSATQLYSFEEGKGFPAIETVMVSRGRYQLTVGAAPVLGTSVNVPFVSIQHRLNPEIFDTSNNELMFGVWMGQASSPIGEKRRRTIWGIKASMPLW